MADEKMRVVLHRSRDVAILICERVDLTFYCLIRPDKLATHIEVAVCAIGHIGGNSWWSQRKLLRIMRKLGRTWDEGRRGAGWSEDLAPAISRSRDLLEQLDLAGVSPLEPEIRDEYDDIIFAVMAKIVSDGTQSLESWVEAVYEIDSKIDNGKALRDALKGVEEILANARFNH